MKNFIQKGDDITIPAPAGGMVSGKLLVVGSLIGVASNTVAEGVDGSIATVGVFRYPKTSALAIAIGDKLYYDAANNVLNKTTGGNTLVGVAVEAAANPSDTIVFKLGTTV